MGLHAECLELTFDYLRLYRTCWQFLTTINDECNVSLQDMYGSGYLNKESQLPCIVGYIFMTTTRTERIRGMLQRRAKHLEATSRVLMQASKCIQSLIDAGGGAIGLKVLKDSHGMDIDVSAMDTLTINDD